jgi:DNA invertase Pin-like site-specific DNA recombinase
VNAIIYARYSSDGQREESIEGQLRECREFAERQNMTVIGTYVEACDIIEPTQRRLINQGFQRLVKFL